MLIKDKEDVTRLLNKYSKREIEQLSALVQKFKGELADVAQHMFEAARETGLREELVHASVTTQCLMMAAFLNISSREAFLNTARDCFDTAERQLPSPDVMTQ